MGLAALSKEDWTPAAVCLMCCGRLIQVLTTAPDQPGKVVQVEVMNPMLKASGLSA